LKQKRIQLTLFAEENKSGVIEKIREAFNPQQYELIKAHVTLCREDELEQLDKVLANLETLHNDYINSFAELVSQSMFNSTNGLVVNKFI
jgi:hypothetical protein